MYLYDLYFSLSMLEQRVALREKTNDVNPIFPFKCLLLTDIALQNTAASFKIRPKLETDAKKIRLAQNFVIAKTYTISCKSL